MTTANENLVIELLVKSDIDALNKMVTGFDLAKDRVAMLVLALDDLATKAGVSFQEATTAAERFNTVQKQVAGTGGTPQSLVDPNTLNMIAKTSQAEIESVQKLNQAEQQRAGVRQINAAREYDATQRQIFALQAQAIKENQINTILVQRSAELSAISKMAPANQINPIAQMINAEMKNGLTDVNGLMKQIQEKFGILPTTMQKVTKEVENQKNGFMNMAKEAFNVSAIMNTLFGVGMAMLVFKLTQAVGQFFTSVLQQVKDVQLAMSSLAAAEEAMSMAGVKVSGQDLLDVVTNLEKKWVNISHTDLLAATGSLALKLADKGLSPQELQDLMDVIMSASVKNPQKSLSDIATMFSQATLSNNYEGVSGLSYITNEDMVKKEALRLGLIKDINEKLTEQERIHAKISMWHNKEVSDEEAIVGMQDNLSNSSKKLSAAWENLAAQLAPAVDIWNMVIYLVATLLNTWTDIIKVLSGTKAAATPMQEAIVKIWNYSGKVWDVLGKFILPGVVAWQNSMNLIAKAYEFISGTKIADQPSILNLGKLDTPTAPITPEMADETGDAAKKIQAWLLNVADAMDAFADKANNMQQDFENAMVKMIAEYNLNRSRVIQDGEISRGKIVRDSEKSIADKEREYRGRQIDEEAKFQEKLRQLREQYLMNLEDALHERDARQVLRLAREYAMNKQNAINEHDLTKKEAERQHKEDIARLKEEAAEKLRLFDEEQALKLARMAEDEAIKEAQASAAYEIEKARLEAEKQDKLKQLEDSLAQQLEITGLGAKAIKDLLASYFDKNGSIDEMMTFTYNNTTQILTEMMKRLLEFYTQYKSVVEDVNNNSNWSEHQPNPETPAKPTTPPGEGYEWVLENGRWVRKKIASSSIPNPTNQSISTTSMLPINLLSSLGGARWGNKSSSGAASMELMVTLSPDLETRIVNRTLDNVSDVIMQVRKARA